MTSYREQGCEVPTGNGGFSVYCAEGASLRTSIPEGAPEGPFHHSSRWLFRYMLNGARVSRAQSSGRVNNSLGVKLVEIESRYKTAITSGISLASGSRRLQFQRQFGSLPWLVVSSSVQWSGEGKFVEATETSKSCRPTQTAFKRTLTFVQIVYYVSITIRPLTTKHLEFEIEHEIDAFISLHLIY
uniref:Uncharacterized protein n=1 Tax=Vespula pensylvanica TaxID=30213 RepID=A0A834UBT4_VESPE|nr:hypothetical protein H0235_005652 [Vespula pensylvanica]